MNIRAFAALLISSLLMIVTPVSAGATGQQTAFTYTKIVEDDLKLTVARCYAPSQYQITNKVLANGIDQWQSPASPFQVVILGQNESAGSMMLYRSSIVYVDPDVYYYEGGLYQGISKMLHARTASEYADYVIPDIAGNGTWSVIGELERTNGEQAFLQNQANELHRRFSAGIVNGVQVTINYTNCSGTRRYYDVDLSGTHFTVVIATAVDQVNITTYDGLSSITFTQWEVPYLYAYVAPQEYFVAGEPDFNVFMSNTRVSDEFIIMNGKVSAAEVAYVRDGTPYNFTSDWFEDTLGYSYGSYSTDAFCDYILEQDSYTTSDGYEVKIPSAYDYVYEGDNGQIYAGNTTDEPAGAERLYKNGGA